MEDLLEIAGKKFKSRLILGTGKYRSNEDMVAAAHASGTQIITVAIRRLNLDNPREKTILDFLDWGNFTLLPNTAGCKTVEEALFTARLAREVTGTNWVKLEVIPDQEYLMPDPLGTYEAASQLIEDDFIVLPYIHADPVLAKKLEDLGCSTVMPLGSPIGSGRGILTYDEINIIIGKSNIPVVVDAGLGVPSEAALAMEMGADAVLVNTAIAQAKNPVQMAEGFRLGVQAGRKGFLSGRISKKDQAVTSSPTEGIVQASNTKR
jgi:thiazole synthase